MAETAGDVVAGISGSAVAGADGVNAWDCDRGAGSEDVNAWDCDRGAGSEDWESCESDNNNGIA